MATYLIHEDNIERLEKQIKTIENKCRKYGCEFSYRRTGNETFKEVFYDGKNSVVARFIEVEAEGTALINGWRFVAVIEHKKDGNIVRQLDTAVEVPERYYHTSNICEHCNSNRPRKDTYLVYNDETAEFKQVGKTCLKDFTGGLDADQAARYVSWFDKLIEGESTEGRSFGDFQIYYNLNQLLTIAAQLVEKYGYVKRSEDPYDYSVTPTSTLSANIYRYLVRGESADNETIQYADEINVDDKDAVKFAEDALTWLRSKEDNSGYFFNLKMSCSSEYVSGRDLGLAVSLIQAYRRELDYVKKQQAERKAQEAKAEISHHQGEVGKKVTFEMKTIKVLSSYYDARFGMNYFYSFTDTEGNEYTWSTGKCLSEDLEEGARYEICGTVKAHSYFKNIAQTQITRCKIKKLADAIHEEGTFDLSSVMNTLESAEA